ncbi:hypothetical protein B0A48_16991 [Cryoendolithus antarcticus]|uniref:Uncharacterized protein n=1 Tax=Cryoendolithus antarcticus TaxID=1507870 RepID=A0A1V8SCL2_9PEZI|nr:hypothetical protein B0A48_16991 [Cryoendolithus antarcticus]
MDEAESSAVVAPTNIAATRRKSRRRDKTRDNGHDKLPRLPKDAELSKRPLFRPAIPSPYSGSDNQKTVYVSAKTPFLSAVKRVEKLLKLADKRTVQSATTIAKQREQSRKRKRSFGEYDGDEIAGIAAVAEEQRKSGEDREEVVIKGTGKAVQKVLELGSWFQQRELEYRVRLRTGSVGAIDDVEVAEPEDDLEAEAGAGTVAPTEGDTANESMLDAGACERRNAPEVRPELDKPPEAVSGTRIRYLSVMEVAVSLI